jgi:hypothetical protein
MEPMKLTVSSKSEPSLPSPSEIPGGRLLSRREASDYLAALGVRLAPATLAKLFCTRSDGPPVRHFGRHPKYEVGALRARALARLSAPRRSSSEPRADPHNA